MGSVRILVVDPKSVQWTVRGVTGDFEVLFEEANAKGTGVEILRAGILRLPIVQPVELDPGTAPHLTTNTTTALH